MPTLEAEGKNHYQNNLEKRTDKLLKMLNLSGEGSMAFLVANLQDEKGVLNQARARWAEGGISFLNSVEWNTFFYLNDPPKKPLEKLPSYTRFKMADRISEKVKEALVLQGDQSLGQVNKEKLVEKLPDLLNHLRGVLKQISQREKLSAEEIKEAFNLFEAVALPYRLAFIEAQADLIALNDRKIKRRVKRTMLFRDYSLAKGQS